MERSRRSTAGQKGRKIGSTLAALRAARQGQARTDQWETPEEEGVFREVDEDEYRKIVQERRQREDFVVDDDGLGYYDDGEEHLGEEEEAARGRAEEMVRARSENRAAKKARKLNAERQNSEAPEQTNSMWRYLESGKAAKATQRSAAALDGLDSLIESVGTGGAGLSTRAPQRLTPSVLERAQLPSSGPQSAVAPRRLPYFETTLPSTGRSTDEVRPWARTTLRDDDDDDAAGGGGGGALGYDDDDDDDALPPAPMDEDDDVPAPAAEAAPAEEEEAPTENSPEPEPEPEPMSEKDVIAAARARLEAKHGVVKNPVFKKPEPKPKEPETPAAEAAAAEKPAATPAPACPPPRLRTALKEEDYLREDEAGKFVEMYWLDASVEGRANTIYVTGKAAVRRDGASTFASCCVQVKNSERNLYVLPRIDPETNEPYTMGAVYAEVKKVLDPMMSGTRAFKCKMVTRQYAFGDEAVPRGETQYLKVKYGADLPPPPARACTQGGATFSKILGANAPPLETFVIKRKLMGPCWVRVYNPKQTSPPVSHCELELTAEDPKHFTVDAESRNKAAPPLTVTTLGVKTAVNPKTQVHEIVAVVALTRRDVSIETATADGGDDEDAALFALDEQRAAQVRRWTMAAVRPLSKEFVDAGEATSTKLPRDFDEERAKARSNERPTFLAAKDVKSPNERALLSALFARLGADDPDVLCGHNIAQFDLDLLISRAIASGLAGQHWSKLGRLKRTAPPRRWKNPQTGRDTFAASAYAGRLICDTYAAAKEHVRGATSYSLASLAQSQLGVNNAIPTPFNDPANVKKALASDRGSDVCSLLWHAGRDARLAERLALRLQILPLSKQLTSISGNLLSRTLRGNRAERIEYLLLHEFHRLKYLVPEKRGYDDANDADDLDGGGGGNKRKKSTAKRAKAAYSGGLVLEPKRGFYDTFILLMDFASLYPSIIQEYDICFTTLRDWARFQSPEDRKALEPAQGPSDSKKKKKKAKKTPDGKPGVPEGGDDANVPEAGDDDDDDDDDDDGNQAPDLLAEELEAPERTGAPTGVLPKVLRSLIAKRREVKSLMKKERDTKKRQTYDIRQMALKLTANSMYGCLGFTHSRFYAKPLAALVTRLGRETLQATAEVAQKELSLEVIYGDTDSIMINTKQTDLKLVKELGARVKREVNKRYKMLELELDGIFKTMLLLKKKKYAALVVKHEDQDGKLVTERETKGLDLVRRDWCKLAKDAGAHVLDVLLSGREQTEVVTEIHKHLEDLGDAVRNGDKPIADFVITKGLGKPIKDYPDGDKQPHVRVAKAMLKRGLTVNVGDYVPHVICCGPGQLADKAHHPDELRDAAAAKKEKHARLATPGSDARPADAPRASADVETQQKKDAAKDAADNTAAAVVESQVSVVTPAPSRDSEAAGFDATDPASSPPLELDAEWYLKNQILQSISRLCEPIELTSKATLATRLGLDARGLTQASLADALRENAKDSFKPQSAMSDEERFGSCQPLRVTCAACHAPVELPLRPKDTAAGDTNKRIDDHDVAPAPSKIPRTPDGRPDGRSRRTPVDVFACPHCKAAALGTDGLSACWDRVSTALKLAVAKYQGKCNQHWKICDECSTRTRQKSDETRCVIQDCPGTLHAEYPEKALYTQLKYFEALFDDARVPGPPDPDRDEVLAFLKKQVSQVIEALPYNYIKPSIFAAFATT